jgi:hypothetical protein
MASMLSTSGCGEDAASKRKANTTVEGVVKEIKVQTRTSKLVGEFSRFYQVQLVADGKANWYGTVAARRVTENDLRLTIGERVSFSCFRDHTYTTCHDLLSLRHNGRELLREAK